MSEIATPPAPLYLAADFASAFLALLPNGPVWPREQGATLPAVAAALAPTYERITARAADLLQEAPAGNLLELLPEWEGTLGLPDPCAGASPSVAVRQASVRAQIAARGGQSIPYFVGLAAALGYTVWVEEFRPLEADFGADDRCYDDEWAHVWIVHLPPPLASAIDDTRVQCTLRRYAPADKVLVFQVDQLFAEADFTTDFLGASNTPVQALGADGAPLTGDDGAPLLI